MAHPIVVAHPIVAQAQDRLRRSGIRQAGSLDVGHRDSTGSATLDATFRGRIQRTNEGAPTPPGAFRQGGPIPNPPRHWQ